MSSPSWTSRERGSPLLGLLRRRLPRTIEGLLPVGDVAIGPRVLAERKTVADLGGGESRNGDPPAVSEPLPSYGARLTA